MPSSVVRRSVLVTLVLTACGGSPTVTPFAADERCPAGGVEIGSGDDATVVCNGANGTDGEDGVAGPAIDTLSAEGVPAAPGGEVALHVEAHVRADATATYAWAASEGWTIASGDGTADVVLTAPDAPRATGSITVRVGDGTGQEAVGVITVSTAASDLPQITAVEIGPQPVIDTATLFVAAEDAGDAPLTATWTIGGIEVATGLAATWTNPGIPGLYDGAVTVTDADGNTTRATFTIVVGSDSAWPAQGGTLQSTDRQDRDTPAAEGTVAWSYDGPGLQNSAVLDGAGNVYAGSWTTDTNGFVVSVTPTGTKRWQRDMTVGTTPDADNSDVFGAPVVANGHVYWSDWAGHLFAADLATGASQWEFFTGGYNDNSSPIVGADGTIYVGSMDPPAMFAVKPDGTQKWKFDTYENVVTDPAIAPDGTIVFADYATLWAVNPDGTERWHRDIGGQNYMNFAIAPNGTVYASSGWNSIVAYDRDGGLLWEFETSSDTRGLALAKDGTVYGVDGNGALVAVWPSGLERWTYWAEGNAWTTPAVGADGTIYFASNSDLHAVDPDGRELWSEPLLSDTTESQVTIGADGTLYIGTDDNMLHAIR